MSEPFTLRRILVALDASAHSLAALEAAADLAAAMQAEIEGLFVEDINLIRLASLPFVREVRHTASLAALDLEQMERALKAQAAEARQALAEAAGRARVRWSFRVSRGHVAREVLAAASAADLVTLGRQGRSARLGSPPARLGSTALEALVGAPVALLLVEHRRAGVRGRHRGPGAGAGPEGGRPVLVVCDDSPGAARALDAAACLAEASGVALTILLLADDGDATRELERGVARSLEGRSLEVRWRTVALAEGGNLLRALQSDEAPLVVLSLSSPRLSEVTVGKLLDHITNPVLLIR